MGCGSSANAGDEKQISEQNVVRSYVLLDILGRGGSCTVKCARKVSEPDDPELAAFAVKMMKNPGPKGINEKLYNAEVDILSNLQHENVINMVESWEDERFFYIVTKLAKGGELFDRIANTKKFGRFTEKRASVLVKTMLSALQHLHNQNIVHRDLKPENFVFQTNSADSQMILIDFGCALRVDPEKEYKDLVGTPYYLAPESAAKRSQRTGEILKRSDVWAVGVIAYIMLTGTPPFKGRRTQDILEEILTKPVSFAPRRKLSHGFKDFVRKTLKKPPKKRYNTEQALKHPWVTGEAASEDVTEEDVLKCLKQFAYQSKLKKLVSRLLAENMGEQPRKKIKEQFKKLDVNGDGSLDEQELIKLLRTLKQTKEEDIPEEAKKMIMEADASGTQDGEIDFEEFATIWQRKLLSVNDNYIKAVFQVIDHDKSGWVELNELTDVFDKIKADELSEVLKEVDADGDGRISFQEFKDAMKESIEDGNGISNDGIQKLNMNEMNADAQRRDIEIKDIDEDEGN